MSEEVTYLEISYAKKGFIKACQKLYGEIHGIPNFSWYTLPNHTPMVYGSPEYEEYQAHVKASKEMYEAIVNDPQYEYVWKCKAMVSRIKRELKSIKQLQNETS